MLTPQAVHAGCSRRCASSLTEAAASLHQPEARRDQELCTERDGAARRTGDRALTTRAQETPKSIALDDDRRDLPASAAWRSETRCSVAVTRWTDACKSPDPFEVDPATCQLDVHAGEIVRHRRRRVRATDSRELLAAISGEGADPETAASISAGGIEVEREPARRAPLAKLGLRFSP